MRLDYFFPVYSNGNELKRRRIKKHGHSRSRLHVIVFRNMFEINYSQLIQYEILEKLVTFMSFDKILYYLLTHANQKGKRGSKENETQHEKLF